MSWIYTAIAFIVIFGIVVVSHEFGHFLLAKVNGIHVVEFSVGMGPKLFGFHKGNTLYALRLLPIGGACMFESEDGLEAENAEHDDTEILTGDTKNKTGAFPDAPIAARIATVLAGPIFNILLAFLLSVILVTICGSDPAVVNAVSDGYPAQEAGMREGDVIVSINNERIRLYREVYLISMMNKGEPLNVVYERDGVRYETILQPKLEETSGSYKMGISGGMPVKYSGFDVVEYSWYEVRYWLIATGKSLKMLVTGNVTWNDVAGPVGIAQVINTTIDETKAYGILTVVLNMINISVLLSVNLGVMNLLPIPALDGGRLILLIIEAIRRKPLPTKLETAVNLTGFVCLMILMVVVFFSDIFKIFSA